MSKSDPLLNKVMRKIANLPAPFRDALQKRGLSIAPSNYYSEIPTVQEILASFEGEERTYCQDLFDKPEMEAFLETLIPLAASFDPPLDQTNGRDEYFWSAKMFSYSDAMTYYSLIRLAKPKRIVEVGSGFSSLVALQGIADNESGSLTCIEPYPREFLRKSDRLDLIEKPAQDISADFINSTIQDGDILFIDSTHTVKHGSDCLHLYLNVLPKIEHDVYVHVHDIYLPFTFSKQSLLNKQIFWTEQYLLGAYLTDNSRTKVLYGSQYSLRHFRELLVKLMHGRYKPGGSSFWFHQKKK